MGSRYQPSASMRSRLSGRSNAMPMAAPAVRIDDGVLSAVATRNDPPMMLLR